MKLIDKDAVVAEIEKLISNGKLKCQQSQENNDQVSYIAWSEHIVTCGKILLFLDTLEVKDVDLESEMKEVKHNYKVDDNQHTSICSADIEWLAEHFFELGLKAQKGE